MKYLVRIKFFGWFFKDSLSTVKHGMIDECGAVGRIKIDRKRDRSKKSSPIATSFTKNPT
jgi:hypothetical protein